MAQEIATAAPPLCAFERTSHRYTLNSIEVPSVTQVLNEERFVDFSGIDAETLEAAQARGSYVHTCLHYYLEGDFDLADVDERYRGYVDSALAYLATLQKQPLRDAFGSAMAVEFRFWHARRWFAGTIDYVGYDADGVLSIDDWKTGQPTDVAAALQTAAYECGLREGLFLDRAGNPIGPLFPTLRKPIRRRAVKLFRDGRPGRPTIYSDPRDLSQFLNALTCVHFRRNGLRHS